MKQKLVELLTPQNCQVSPEILKTVDKILKIVEEENLEDDETLAGGTKAGGYR